MFTRIFLKKHESGLCQMPLAQNYITTPLLKYRHPQNTHQLIHHVHVVHACLLNLRSLFDGLQEFESRKSFSHGPQVERQLDAGSCSKTNMEGPKMMGLGSVVAPALNMAHFWYQFVKFLQITIVISCPETNRNFAPEI